MKGVCSLFNKEVTYGLSAHIWEVGTTSTLKKPFDSTVRAGIVRIIVKLFQPVFQLLLFHARRVAFTSAGTENVANFLSKIFNYIG